MGRYLGKRLASTIPLLLVISFVVFMFIHMIPGDPARLVAGQDATKEDVAVVREQLGLDEPLLVQYGKYMKSYSVRWDWRVPHGLLQGRFQGLPSSSSSCL